jgi:serine/threonine protein kinase
MSALSNRPSLEFTLQSERIEPLRLLGEGTYGVVHLAWDNQLLCARALKVFKPEEDGDVAESALREVAFLSFLKDIRAPCIVPLLEIIVGDGSTLAILMPLMEEDLSDAIADLAFPTWSHARPPLEDILQGLDFLHSCRPPLMHRDLKPENVLRDPTGRYCLTDMGFMRFTHDGPPYDDTRFSHGSNQRATASYSAPEMLRHGTAHGPPVDVWATGVIAVELLQNRRLSALTDRTARRQCRQICQKNKDSPAFGLLVELLQEEPSKRITAAAARTHAALASPSMTAPPALPVMDLVQPAQPSEPAITPSIRRLMHLLQFSSPQTFHGACAFFDDARSLRCEPLLSASDDELLQYAVVMAAKLYEHEYWGLSDLRKLLSGSFDEDRFILFQKSMVRRRAGRLLVPFTSWAPEGLAQRRPRRRRRAKQEKEACEECAEPERELPAGSGEAPVGAPPQAVDV